MDWRDEGILLSVMRHAEHNVIIGVLTRTHGRHAGLVRGGRSQKLAPTLQPGAQLALDWNARLDEHLGVFRVEPITGRAASLMGDRLALSAFNAMSALILAFVPEREPAPDLYDETLQLVEALCARDDGWTVLYALWELRFLRSLGFGIDLTRCAATGVTVDLAYVSPRSGRAVSRSAGGPRADKMLPLPGVLTGTGKGTLGDAREALRMTGWFLEHWVCPGFERAALPDARGRLIDLLERHVPLPAPDDTDDAETAPGTGPERQRGAHHKAARY